MLRGLSRMQKYISAIEYDRCKECKDFVFLLKDPQRTVTTGTSEVTTAESSWANFFVSRLQTYVQPSRRI